MDYKIFQEIDLKINELQISLQNIVPDENISEQFKEGNLLKQKRVIKEQIRQLNIEKRNYVAESICEVLALSNLTVSEGIAALNQAITTIPQKAKCSL